MNAALRQFRTLKAMTWWLADYILVTKTIINLHGSFETLEELPEL